MFSSVRFGFLQHCHSIIIAVRYSLMFLGMSLKAYAAQSSQSLEVTSKAIVADEDMNDRVKTLSERLSAALLNISAKEQLVKQHAKVAEEAVSGINSNNLSVFVNSLLRVSASFFFPEVGRHSLFIPYPSS